MNIRCIFLMLMASLSTPAFSSVQCNFIGSGEAIVTFPKNISVAPSAPVGTVLAHADFSSGPTWRCITPPLETVGVGFDMVPVPSAGITYNGPYAPWGGVPIYETGVPGVGFGVIARVTDFLASGKTFDFPFRAVTSKMTKDSSPPRLSQDEHTVGMRGVVFLVKTGQVGTGGTIDYKNFALGTLLINGRISSIVIPRNVIHVDSRDSTNINRWTCTTPDIDVVMGSFKTTDFPRAGSLSPGAGASVPIRFLNCPALGAGHTIQYRIDPVSGTVGRNVAALTGGSSTAKGLGILLFDAYGAVFPLSQNQRLKEFNSGVGGSYTVPLTARYYATGAVTAGQANSSMTLTVSYQ